MPRSTKYNEARANKLLEGLKAGMTLKAACALIPIDFKTFQYWQQRFSRFSTQVDHAVHEAEARYTGVIAKAAFGYDEIEITTITHADKSVEVREVRHRKFHPQMALELLKRRFREEWGDKQEVTGADGGPVRFVVEVPPRIESADEWLQQYKLTDGTK